MSDGEVLLRAIRTQADEDTPRLVYADWLQEHGDEARAELIRVECALFRASEGTPTRVALRERQRALWTENGPRWLAALPGRRGIRWYKATSRGFFDAINVRNLKIAEQHSSAILGSETVRQVRLEPPGTLAGFVRVPLFAATERLDTWHETGGGAGLAALADSPYAGNLQSMTVYARHTEEAQLVDLLGSPRVPHLTEFSGAGLSVVVGAASVVSAPATLRFLLLADCRFAPGALGALFALPTAGALEEVRLQHSGDSGDALAAALAGANHIKGLRVLNLKETALTEVGAVAFRAPHLRSLQKVVLTRGLVPTGAVRALKRALPDAHVRVDSRR